MAIKDDFGDRMKAYEAAEDRRLDVHLPLGQLLAKCPENRRTPMPSEREALRECVEALRPFLIEMADIHDDWADDNLFHTTLCVGDIRRAAFALRTAEAALQEVPNAETQEAIMAVERGDVVRHSTVRSLMQDLDDDLDT